MIAFDHFVNLKMIIEYYHSFYFEFDDQFLFFFFDFRNFHWWLIFRIFHVCKSHFFKKISQQCQNSFWLWFAFSFISTNHFEQSQNMFCFDELTYVQRSDRLFFTKIKFKSNEMFFLYECLIFFDIFHMTEYIDAFFDVNCFISINSQFVDKCFLFFCDQFHHVIDELCADDFRMH